MPRIGTYEQDSTLSKLDKLLGSDSGSTGTKMYSIDSIVTLINEINAIDTFDGLLYEFKDYLAEATDPQGVLNLTGTNTIATNFSAVTQLILSDKAIDERDYENLLASFTDTTIRISERTNGDVFGIFKVLTVSDHTNSEYKIFTLQHIKGNGQLTPGRNYFISVFQASLDSDLSGRNVTEFGDVTSSGSGSIITNAERNIVNSSLVHNDVVDNVTSTSTDVPLSANQGKILKDLIDNINTLLTSDNVDLDSLQEVVDYIEANRSSLNTLSISNIAGLQTALDGKQATETGKGLSTNDFTTALLNKLNSIAAGAEVNVNADWSSTSGDSQILNKPTDITDLSSHNVTELSDVNSAGSGYIITNAERTKLTGLDVNATTRVVTDGTDSVTIPPANAEQNVQSNWNETNSSSDSFIQNKPTIPTNTTYDLTVAQSGDDAVITLEGSDNVDDDITLAAGTYIDITVNSGTATIDADLTTGAVANNATTLVTGDHVFDYLQNFARKDQAETFSNNVTIQGNLTVTGTQTTVNSNQVEIGDAIITLNSDIASNAAPSENAGIEVDRGSSTNVLLRWNESTDKWQFTNDGSTYEDINAASPLNDITDVNITSLSNNQVLRYNNSSSKWENVSLTTDDIPQGSSNTYFPGFGTTSFTALAGNTQFVDGTGTAGTLPKMQDSDTIIDSSISDCRYRYYRCY